MTPNTDLIHRILTSFADGPDLERWLCIKLVAAFLGGLSAHIIENELRIRTNKTRIYFFWRGFLFTFVSAIGGLFLLKPSDASAAFMAGLVGWYACINIIRQQNQGLTDTSIETGVLSGADIQQRLREGQR